MLGVVQAGKMSFEAFFDLLKRGDLHDSELTFDDEQGRIDADPSIPAPVPPGEGETEPGESGDETAIDKSKVKPKPKPEGK